MDVPWQRASRPPLDGVVSGDPTIIGMRLPVLRETRMPAVVVTVGPVRAIVDAAETVSRAVEVALREWLRRMADDPTDALPDRRRLATLDVTVHLTVYPQIRTHPVRLSEGDVETNLT